MQLAKKLISDEYPRIMPVRCIAHHIQLICTDIMKKIQLAKNMLINCQKFVTYFTESHQSGATLREEIKKRVNYWWGVKEFCQNKMEYCMGLLLISFAFRNYF